MVPSNFASFRMEWIWWFNNFWNSGFSRKKGQRGKNIHPLYTLNFDPQFGKNQKSAEIQFLKSILEMQKSGFWYEKAKEKLNTLIR